VQGLGLASSYTAIASDSYGRHATNTVNVNLATNVTFQYDGNGNLTNDGLRNFAYDDENQLVQVSVPSNWMSQFSYDGRMRRRIRQEFTWQGSGWVQTNAVYYVYDGNLVIQERDVNNLPTTIYTRGKDLSGSLDGAGGIGGLLARTAQSYVDAPLEGHAFYHADANGNITMLINSSQAVVAKYLYDAFGNVLSASGLLADANRYQFSSKEKDLNSGLVYYLYRFYDPNLQRWPNRDPIGESGFEVLRFRSSGILPIVSLLGSIGGTDLYGFVQNRPIDVIDPLGLAPSTGPGSIACESATEQAEAALAAWRKNESEANRLAVLAAVAKMAAACKPPNPPPTPPPVPPWCPPNRWVPPYIPPMNPQQQCTLAVGAGGVLVVICIIAFSPVGL